MIHKIGINCFVDIEAGLLTLIIIMIVVVK